MTWPRTAAQLALALFLVVSALGVQTGLRLWDQHSRENREAALKWATEQAALTRKELIHALDARLEHVEYQAVAEIRHTRKVALAEIAATRDRLDDRFSKIQVDANTQLTGTLELADRRLGETNEIVREQLAAVNANASRVAEPSGMLLRQLNDAAPLWLDCDHNADCAFNRYVGTARGIEQFTAAAGRYADPQQAALTGIAQDVHTFTSKFVAPKTKKQKAWEALKLGVFAVGRVFGG